MSSERDGPTRKDLAFSIHASKNIYRCFRCGSTGNALDFWQAYRATSLHEAAKELSRNP
ncbi:MAG: CHC2 zinc finger domain-containing protein [Planctomyces sp.]